MRWSYSLAIAGTLLVIAQAAASARPAPSAPPTSVGERGGRTGRVVGTSLTSADRERLARQFAPVVWIHAKERFGPASPEAFIRAASLSWRRPGEDKRVAGRGEVAAARLGAPCAGVDDCYSYGRYRSSQLTRPHDGRRGRPRGLSKDQGFYLDPPSSARRGQVGVRPTVPVFYEVSSGRALRITYWFFYGFSQPYKPFRGRNLASIISHQGDWENIDVSLDLAGTPKAVYFYGHGRARPRPWSRVCKLVGILEDCVSPAAGRPVVYSARFSHASYPTPGEVGQRRSRVCKRVLGRNVCSYDVRNRGFLWDPLAPGGRLQDVRTQPWYGFGGAWGNAGAVADTTGPLGPSRFKRSNDLEPGEQVSQP